MRDFRDAKAMAQTLRDSLNSKTAPISPPISHSESLELVSKMLGLQDWNTLSALLQAGQQEPSTIKHPQDTASYPAIPVRDFVPFPGSYFPLFIGREKTKQALDRAFASHREVVLAVQRDESVDEPGQGDIYELGVLATVMELQRLPDGVEILGKTLNAAMKIMLMATRRVAIRKFTGGAGAYQAEITNISEGPIPDALELIRKALEGFEAYAAKHDLDMQRIRSTIGQSDPGRVADVICAFVTLPINDKQSLLATLDPVARLEKIIALMERNLATV